MWIFIKITCVETLTSWLWPKILSKVENSNTGEVYVRVIIKNLKRDGRVKNSNIKFILKNHNYMLIYRLVIQ